MKRKLTLSKGEVEDVLKTEFQRRTTVRSLNFFLKCLSQQVERMSGRNPDVRRHAQKSIAQLINKYCSDIRGSYVISTILQLQDVGKTDQLTKPLRHTRNMFQEILLDGERIAQQRNNKGNEDDLLEELHAEPEEPYKKIYDLTGIVDQKLRELKADPEFSLEKLALFLENNQVKRVDGGLVLQLMRAYSVALKNDLYISTLLEMETIEEIRDRGAIIYDKIKILIKKNLSKLSPFHISSLLNAYYNSQTVDKEILSLIKERVFQKNFLKRIPFFLVPNILKCMAYLEVDLTEDEVFQLIEVFEKTNRLEDELNEGKQFLNLSRLAIALMLYQHPLAMEYYCQSQLSYDDTPFMASYVNSEKESTALEEMTSKALSQLLGPHFDVERNIKALLFEVDFKITHIPSGRLYLLEADGPIYHFQPFDKRRDAAILHYSAEEYQDIIRINTAECVGGGAVVGKNYPRYKNFIREKLLEAGIEIAGEERGGAKKRA